MPLPQWLTSSGRTASSGYVSSFVFTTAALFVDALAIMWAPSWRHVGIKMRSFCTHASLVLTDAHRDERLTRMNCTDSKYKYNNKTLFFWVP